MNAAAVAAAHSVYVWIMYKNKLNLFQTNNSAIMYTYLFHIPYNTYVQRWPECQYRDSSIPAVAACAALPRFIFDTNPKKANFIHYPITEWLLFSVHSLIPPSPLPLSLALRIPNNTVGD